jgi:hypothetical protein
MLYLIIIKKLKHMTKKEIKNTINKAVYKFVESLGYQISDDNDGSYVTFSKDNFKTYDDTIDYHRSRQECCVLSCACAESKSDADKIDNYVQELKLTIK